MVVIPLYEYIIIKLCTTVQTRLIGPLCDHIRAIKARLGEKEHDRTITHELSNSTIHKVTPPGCRPGQDLLIPSIMARRAMRRAPR